MKRLHLIELQDQFWFPASARDALTDYIRSAFALFRPPTQILSYINYVLDKAGADRIVDLCSGGGGPWSSLCRSIRSALPNSICLTDKFPNVRAFEQAALNSQGRIEFIRYPVDATAFPPTIPGVRTLFCSFHHFRPPEARAILADAINRHQGIAIFELTRPSIASILSMLATPVLVMLLTPFVRPFRFSRLVWTYIIPIIPPAALIDGIVSCLRTYSLHEMRELIAGLPAEHYGWEVGEAKSRWGGISWLYVLGYPLGIEQPHDRSQGEPHLGAEV
jgi:hypothetical protein